MADVRMQDEIEIGDMNGPLTYWGPSAAIRPHPVLSVEEQALLLRLRERLEGNLPGAVSLGEALDTLLDLTAEVAVPA